MSYNKYPREIKETVVAKLPEEDVIITDVQREMGIGINTI